MVPTNEGDVVRLHGDDQIGHLDVLEAQLSTSVPAELAHVELTELDHRLTDPRAHRLTLHDVGPRRRHLEGQSLVGGELFEHDASHDRAGCIAGAEGDDLQAAHRYSLRRSHISANQPKSGGR